MSKTLEQRKLLLQEQNKFEAEVIRNHWTARFISLMAAYSNADGFYIERTTSKTPGVASLCATFRIGPEDTCEHTAEQHHVYTFKPSSDYSRDYIHLPTHIAGSVPDLECIGLERQLESADYYLNNYLSDRAEAERKHRVRQAALAKLSDEERELLEIRSF